jgi:hypothetical protein
VTGTLSMATVSCPSCLGAGVVCAFCHQPDCKPEDRTEEHDAFADADTCGLCGGAGDVLTEVATVWERRQQERPGTQIVQLPDGDVDF